MRAQAQALWKHAGFDQRTIAAKLGKSLGWVNKWCSESSNFADSPRSGRPRTALTATNMRKLDERAQKPNSGVRPMGRKLKISKSSASRGYLEQDLPARRRTKQSKIKEAHELMRLESAGNFKDEPPEFWEDWMTSDEKIWTVNGSINPQNDVIRAHPGEDVPVWEQEKFLDSG